MGNGILVIFTLFGLIYSQESNPARTTCPHGCINLETLSSLSSCSFSENDRKLKAVSSEISTDLDFLKAAVNNLSQEKITALGGNLEQIEEKIVNTSVQNLQKTKEDIEEVKNLIQALVAAQNMTQEFSDLKEMIKEIPIRTSSGYHGCSNENNTSEYPIDCQEVVERGGQVSGLYFIQPRQSERFQIFCDIDYSAKDGFQGWGVMQHRFNGIESFNRSWLEYKEGFGDLKGEFWLGNEKIHKITTQGIHMLRIEYHIPKDNYEHYNLYSLFHISPESQNYSLFVQGAVGPNDRLTYFNKKQFTTYDRDNDGSDTINCAEDGGGGWWHYHTSTNYGCDYGYSNLNGIYGCTEHDLGCLRWHFDFPYVTTMKIKRVF